MEIPQKFPFWNISLGLYENPVRMNPAHTNRNGRMALNIAIYNFFIGLHYFLALVKLSNQDIVINAPIAETASTIRTLFLVQGITHVNASDTALKKKNDAALISR